MFNYVKYQSMPISYGMDQLNTFNVVIDCQKRTNVFRILSYLEFAFISRSSPVEPTKLRTCLRGSTRNYGFNLYGESSGIRIHGCHREFLYIIARHRHGVFYRHYSRYSHISKPSLDESHRTKKNVEQLHELETYGFIRLNT